MNDTKNDDTATPPTADAGKPAEAPAKPAAKAKKPKAAKPTAKTGPAVNHLGPGGSLRNRPGRVLGAGRGSIVPTSRG